MARPVGVAAPRVCAALPSLSVTVAGRAAGGAGSASLVPRHRVVPLFVANTIRHRDYLARAWLEGGGGRGGGAHTRPSLGASLSRYQYAAAHG